AQGPRMNQEKLTAHCSLVLLGITYSELDLLDKVEDVEYEKSIVNGTCMLCFFVVTCH
ncbi:hypothetical protein MKW98_003455, partial [Papaver atlanticum]